MFKNKLISIILIVCISVGVPLAFCLNSFALSEVYVEDLYKSNSVEYLLSNPHFEIIDYVRNERFDYSGEGGGSELDFAFPPASSTGGITDRTTVNLGVAGALLGEYSPSYDVYYRFTFDVRVLWTANELRSKYNLDILASTDVGGCVMVMSKTYSYVQFITDEVEPGEFDSFYYTNTGTSAYLPQKSSFDMRLYSVAPNKLRITVTLRLLQGQPKYNRSIDLQFIINSKEAEGEYVSSIDKDKYDSYFKREDEISANAGALMSESYNGIFAYNSLDNIDIRKSFATVSALYQSFMSSNPIIEYLVGASALIGCSCFVLGITPVIISKISFNVRSRSKKGGG